MNDCRCCLFVINSLIIGQINELADEIWEQTCEEKTVVSQEETNLNLSNEQKLD